MLKKNLKAAKLLASAGVWALREVFTSFHRGLGGTDIREN